jgi:hypothetical protein
MKKSLLILSICVSIFQTAMAQKEQTMPAAAPTPAIPAAAASTVNADPADVSTLDGIMKAVYDSISGDAGAPRNWDRLRSLFHADARLIPAGKNAQTGVVGAHAYTPDGYIERATPAFAKQGFYEHELARKVETYGAITHVFSTYASYHSNKKDEAPFARGINSFQLMFDGKRWWVVTIYWQAETPDNLLPEKYLKNGN